jgi:hypothetical protein
MRNDLVIVLSNVFGIWKSTFIIKDHNNQFNSPPQKKNHVQACPKPNLDFHHRFCCRLCVLANLGDNSQYNEYFKSEDVIFKQSLFSFILSQLFHYQYH